MIATVLLGVAIAAAQEPPSYELVDAFPAQAKFDKPLLLAHHETDPEKYYVVEQDGTIYRIPRDGAGDERSVFLDWTDVVHRDNWEEGLLGLAFDPGYESNGHLFVYWSQGLDGGRRQSVISRLKVDRRGDPRVTEDDQLDILTVFQPWGNHNGGTILFGADEMLYIAFGDGGAGNDPKGNGQNVKTLLGTICRIDVRNATAEAPYEIPADNPFAEEAGARGEIWAYGLRNPWRISFDRETGELWCGDVGQGKWEEVNRIVKGGNYGWNRKEGTRDFEHSKYTQPRPGLIPPVHEYGRKQGLSITGGHVYRGSALGELDGHFVFGDFVTGRIWAVREGDEGAQADATLLCTAPGSIASFAEEPDGELLVLSFDGRIYRLARANT